MTPNFIESTPGNIFPQNEKLLITSNLILTKNLFIKITFSFFIIKINNLIACFYFPNFSDLFHPKNPPFFGTKTPYFFPATSVPRTMLHSIANKSHALLSFKTAPQKAYKLVRILSRPSLFITLTPQRVFSGLA